MEDRPFKTIPYFVGIYALVLSALYLLGYWGAFRFNVLEFIGLSDALNYSLYPLLIALVPPVFGSLFAQVSAGARLPSGGGADTAFGRFVQRHRDLLLLADFLLVPVILYFGGEPGRWVLLMIPIIFAAPALTHVELFVQLMPDPRTRSFIVASVPILAMMAFANGRINATDVLQGRAPLVVDVPASGLQLPFDEQHPVAYVGHAGDFFLLYESKAPRLVILKTDKIGPLVLMRNPKRYPMATPTQSLSPRAVVSPSATNSK